MDDFASSAWKKGDVAVESSLPMPDFAVDNLSGRFGLDAEFWLLCSILTAA
jgi:hypothetical protein